MRFKKVIMCFCKIFFLLMLISLFKFNIVKAESKPVYSTPPTGDGIQNLGSSTNGAQYEGWHYPDGYWLFTSNLTDGYSLGTVRVNDSEWNPTVDKPMCVKIDIPSSVQQYMSQYGAESLKITATPTTGIDKIASNLKYEVCGYSGAYYLRLTFDGKFKTKGENYWDRNSNPPGSFFLPVPLSPTYGNNNFSVFYTPSYGGYHLGAVLTGASGGQVNSATEITNKGDRGGYLQNNKYYTVYTDSGSVESVDGGKLSIGPGSFTKGGAQGVTFNFGFNVGFYVDTTKKVMLTTTDNEINSNGDVVTQNDGRDYFGRNDTEYEYTGTPIDVTATSPTSGQGKEFAFAIIDTGNGNPTTCLGNPHITSQTVATQIADKGVYVHFYWRSTINPSGKIRLNVTDNELDANGNVVTQADGKDYFGRLDTEHDLPTGTDTITVSTVTGGSSKPDLEFAFAIIDNANGNPTACLNQPHQNSTSIPVTVNTSKEEWYVHFYYKPKGTVTPAGAIVFNPNSTSWTNLGKSGEGSGSYPVTVTYVGPNPTILQGKAIIHHHEEKANPNDKDGKPVSPTIVDFDYTSQFPVNYKLESITVTGDANTTITGASGIVNITKEGANLHLNGVGTWKTPVEGQDYTLPSPKEYESIASTVIPPTPEKPTGSSGQYNLDWTKPPININPRAISNWINSPVPYPVGVTSTDNLSGFRSGSNVSVSDYSHYARNNNDVLPFGGLSYNKSIMLSDGMYNIGVISNDIAGNDNSDSSQTYRIDGTLPDVSFNIPSGIFSEANGAVRKQSKKGSNFAYYGNLTYSDNLSGIAKCDYSWTFTNNDNGTYETIYTSPYTYTDRYTESFTSEIEKPVGDNMFLHVRLWDTAGNYKVSIYGPFEDPIKLKDFQVTDVRDPNWDDVFWTNKFTTPSGTTYKVNKLPIDADSHPTLKNATPKLGYSFYFDITSEFLYRDNDRIEVTPSFYYWDGKTRTPVDCYYNLENNPFTKVGSSKDNVRLNLDTNKYGSVLIGGLSKLTLTKGVRIDNGAEWNSWKDTIQYTNGKEQWWYGKYYLPATSIFVKHGDIPRPENVLKKNNVIINFEIIAYKNGIETLSSDQIFAYVPTQWTAERGPKNPIYKEGDVLLYDNKYNVLSNYRTFIIQ